MIRIEAIGQLQRIIGCGRRTELHPERVADVSHQLNVGTMQLPGALANPQEVAGGPVRLPSPESIRVSACSYSKISASWLE